MIAKANLKILCNAFNTMGIPTKGNSLKDRQTLHRFSGKNHHVGKLVGSNIIGRGNGNWLSSSILCHKDWMTKVPHITLNFTKITLILSLIAPCLDGAGFKMGLLSLGNSSQIACDAGTGCTILCKDIGGILPQTSGLTF